MQLKLILSLRSNLLVRVESFDKVFLKFLILCRRNVSRPILRFLIKFEPDIFDVTPLEQNLAPAEGPRAGKAYVGVSFTPS